MYFERGLRFFQEGNLRTKPLKKNLSVPFFRTKTVLLHPLVKIYIKTRRCRPQHPGPHENEAKNQHERT